MSNNIDSRIPEQSPPPGTPLSVLEAVIPEVERVYKEHNGTAFSSLQLPVRQLLGLFGYFDTDMHSQVLDNDTFRQQRRLSEALGKFATSFGSQFSEIEEFADAREQEVLGLTLCATMLGAVAVRGYGVHFEGPGDRVSGGGIATADWHAITFVNDRLMRRMSSIFGAGLASQPAKHAVHEYPASDDWAPATVWERRWQPGPSPRSVPAAGTQPEQENTAIKRGSTPPTLEVSRLTEFIRSPEEAMREMARRELAAANIVMMHNKATLEKLEETMTLHPLMRQFLEAVDETYRRAVAEDSEFVQADYRLEGAPDELQPDRNKHISTADWNPLRKFLRSTFNGIIDYARGGSQFNLEQNPYRNQRYPFETVDLMRPKYKPEEVYEGTRTAVPMSKLDLLKTDIRDTWDAVRSNPKNFVRKHITDYLRNNREQLLLGLADKVWNGFTFALNVEGTVRKLIAKGVVAGVRYTINDYRDNSAWYDQRHQAHTHLGSILKNLKTVRKEIAANQKANDFSAIPTVELENKPALRIIQAMTAYMENNLAGKPPDGSLLLLDFLNESAPAGDS